MRELAAWRRDAGLSGGVTNASTAVYEEEAADPGAIVMGRAMFGGTGPWDDEWIGWWGDDPPLRLPVFVSPTIPDKRCTLAAGRRSPSSPKAPRRRSRVPVRRRATGMWQ